MFSVLKMNLPERAKPPEWNAALFLSVHFGANQYPVIDKHPAVGG